MSVHIENTFTRLRQALGDAKEGAASFREKRPPNFATRPSKDIAFVDRWWPKSAT